MQYTRKRIRMGGADVPIDIGRSVVQVEVASATLRPVVARAAKKGQPVVRLIPVAAEGHSAAFLYPVLVVPVPSL